MAVHHLDSKIIIIINTSHRLKCASFYRACTSFFRAYILTSYCSSFFSSLYTHIVHARHSFRAYISPRTCSSFFSSLLVILFELIYSQRTCSSFFSSLWTHSIPYDMYIVLRSNHLYAFLRTNHQYILLRSNLSSYSYIILTTRHILCPCVYKFTSL